jgi:hypothetical protein
MSEDLKKKILSTYKHECLEHSRRPSSIFKLCRGVGIREKDFYQHFSNFQSVEREVWKSLLNNTLKDLESDETWVDYSHREKHLAFLFSWFESLTDERSYIMILMDDDDWSHVMPKLKTLRKYFLTLVSPWTPSCQLDMDLPFELLEGLQQEPMWWQFLFLMNYWKSDTSNGFQKTDVAIEKSTHLIFDLLEQKVFKSGLDFFKFVGGGLLEDMNSPMDMFRKFSKACS